MSGFIATSPAPTDPVPVPVCADGWYPEVDLTALRRRTRLDDGTWDDALLIPMVREAADAIAGVLADWRAAREAEGAASLAAVTPADALTGTPIAVLRWQAALDCRVRAAVILATRDFDSTKSGHDRADALEATADDWLTRGHEALSRLMGRPRTVVELI